MWPKKCQINNRIDRTAVTQTWWMIICAVIIYFCKVSIWAISLLTFVTTGKLFRVLLYPHLNFLRNKYLISEYFQIYRNIANIIYLYLCIYIYICVYIYPTPNFLFYSCLTLLWHICHNEWINTNTALLNKPCFVQVAFVFIECPVSKIPSGTPHSIWLSCPLRLLLAATVSQTLLLFDNLDSVFFFFIFIYVAVPGLSCSTWESSIFIVVCRIFSCGLWKLIP